VSFGATSNLHVAKPVLSKATGRGIVLRQRSYSRFLAEGNTQHEGFSTDTFAPAATVTLSIEITCVRHRFEPRYGGPYAGYGATHRPMSWAWRGKDHTPMALCPAATPVAVPPAVSVSLPRRWSPVASAASVRKPGSCARSRFHECIGNKNTAVGRPF